MPERASAEGVGIDGLDGMPGREMWPIASRTAPRVLPQRRCRRGPHDHPAPRFNDQSASRRRRSRPSCAFCIYFEVVGFLDRRPIHNRVRGSQQVHAPGHAGRVIGEMPSAV